jgi:uncharacterized protein YkwD
MRLQLLTLIAIAACGPKDPPNGPDGTTDDDPTPVARDPDPEPDSPEASASRLSPDAQILVDEHNRYRAEHCADPLTWDDELAAVAQAWADKLEDAGCAFEHSSTPYGENLAAGSSGAMPPEDVVAMWYREVDAYDFKKGRFSMETGHFTQLVWRDTKRLGCGMTRCNGFDLWVCNYDPPGNVEGQYKDQVKKGC